MSYASEHLHNSDCLSLTFTHEQHLGRVRNSWIIIICPQNSLTTAPGSSGIQYLQTRTHELIGFFFHNVSRIFVCVYFKTFSRICLWVGQYLSGGEYIVLVEWNILGPINEKETVKSLQSGTHTQVIKTMWRNRHRRWGKEVDVGESAESLPSQDRKRGMSEELRGSLTKESFQWSRPANSLSWQWDSHLMRMT